MPVKAYNRNMNGVDRSDQMRTAYSSARTSKRWWTYLFWFLIDLSISNALILMWESRNHKLVSRASRTKDRPLINFRKNLAVQFIAQERNGRKRSIRPDISGDGHWPKRVETKRRWRNCSRRNVNGQSRFICTGCSDLDTGK